MVLNAAKTGKPRVCRFRTLPAFPVLRLANSVLIESALELPLLGATFDSRLTLASHIRSLAAVATQKFGIMRKAFRVFAMRCFWMRCTCYALIFDIIVSCMYLNTVLLFGVWLLHVT